MCSCTERSARYGAYLSVRLRADGTVIEGRVQSVRSDYPERIPMPDPQGEAARLMDQRGHRDFRGNVAHVGPDGAIAVP